MENKFKIVCLGSLILATEFFVLGEKEAEIIDIKGGKKEFTITDAHMTFKDGVQVPKAGMDAHNNANGGAGFRDNIILEGRGSSRSEIKGQLSIKDNSVENLFIVDKNGIYVDGGSFSGADNVILSGKNKDGGPNGTVELVDLKRAKEDGIKADSKKLQVHVQDARVIGELNLAQSEAIFDNQEAVAGGLFGRGAKDAERGVEVSYHYNPGDKRKEYDGKSLWIIGGPSWMIREDNVQETKMVRYTEVNQRLTKYRYLPKNTQIGRAKTAGYKAPEDVVALMNQIDGRNQQPNIVPVQPNPNDERRPVVQSESHGSDYMQRQAKGQSGKKQRTEGDTTTPNDDFKDKYGGINSFEELVQDMWLDDQATTMKSGTPSTVTETSYGDYFYDNTPRTEGMTAFDGMDKTRDTETIRSNVPTNNTDLVDFSHLDSSFFSKTISTESSSMLEEEGSFERLNLSSAQADELSAEASEDRGNRRRLREESNS